jgi:hypothetical protein
MAHIKLLCPGISPLCCLFQFTGPHTALLSQALPEDQLQEGTEGSETLKVRMPLSAPWRSISKNVQPRVFFKQEEATKSLHFLLEEDNDYEEGGRAEDFIHALQLEEELNLNDMETVRSELFSRVGRKLSASSEVESEDGNSSVALSLVD